MKWAVVAILVAAFPFLRGEGEMAAWTAKWIWIEGTWDKGHGTRDKGHKKRDEGLQRNFYLCARKTFDVPKDLQTATLRITADARYVLLSLIHI